MVTPRQNMKPLIETQEELLLDYLLHLEKHKTGQRAVYIQLSMLQRHNRRDHHVRLAADTFSQLIKSKKGQLFILKNLDIFFAYRGECHDDVETSIFKLRYLFSEDPFLESKIENLKQPFQRYFNVERDFKNMVYFIRNNTRPAIQNQEKRQKINPPSHQLKCEQDKQLTPQSLGALAQALKNTDLTNMIRSETICGLVGHAVPQILINELFISIETLGETLIPGINLKNRKWLYYHLTEIIDKRMLATLRKSNHLFGKGDICLNLNVSTLLSQEFALFDDKLLASERNTVIVNLQLIDILSNLSEFATAREYAKYRDYRICIDGLTHETLNLINTERLGTDLVKITWSSEGLESAYKNNLSGLFNTMGTPRVILCQCNNKEAIDFGHKFGIGMFQGLYIEKIITDASRHRDLKTTASGS